MTAVLFYQIGKAKVSMDTIDYLQLEKNCKACGVEFVAVSEYVDIGVGAQTHILYYECLCGPIAFCTACGVIDGYTHLDWCNTVAKLEPCRCTLPGATKEFCIKRCL